MYCRKCGKEVAENQEYCEECKAMEEIKAQNNVQSESKPEVSHVKQRKKCCPKCKSRNIQFVNNTEYHSETKGGGYSAGKGCCGYMALGPLGLLCGACGSKSKTTVTSSTSNAWICKDCGNKFRNVEDIDIQIYSIEKSKPYCIMLMVIASLILFITILSAVNSDHNLSGDEVSILMGYGGLALILFISQILRFVKNNSAIECLKSEKQNIEKNGYIDE